MGYISKVNDWVSKQKNITGEEFVHKLDELQVSEMNIACNMEYYIHCIHTTSIYEYIAIVAILYSKCCML